MDAARSGWMVAARADCSALSGDGIGEIWQMILDQREQLVQSGRLAARQSHQAIEWMKELIALDLEASFRSDAEVARRLPELQEAMKVGQVTPFAATRELPAIFHSFLSEGGRLPPRTRTS